MAAILHSSPFSSAILIQISSPISDETLTLRKIPKSIVFIGYMKKSEAVHMRGRPDCSEVTFEEAQKSNICY
jgi:hypothetical protein